MRLIAPHPIVCDPVHPNVGVEAWYARTIQEALRPLHDEIVSDLGAIWFSPNPVGMAQDARRAPLPAEVSKAMAAWAKKWDARWDEMSKRIAEDFASRSQRATDVAVAASFRRAGFTVKFKPTRVMLLAYSVRVQQNVNLIRTIPQQYLKDVSQKVWDAVTTGADLNQLTSDIQSVYGVATRRAAFIARDQNNKAKASFENTRRMELGIEQAEWAHSSAGKEPRPSHVTAGRKRVRYTLKDGWLDPAIGKRIWPGTEINCRCTSRAIIPGIG